jgi:hypothetical protein
LRDDAIGYEEIVHSRKAWPMKFYRCYFLSASNAIKDAAEFGCYDDAQAID